MVGTLATRRRAVLASCRMVSEPSRRRWDSVQRNAPREVPDDAGRRARSQQVFYGLAQIAAVPAFDGVTQAIPYEVGDDRPHLIRGQAVKCCMSVSSGTINRRTLFLPCGRPAELGCSSVGCRPVQVRPASRCTETVSGFFRFACRQLHQPGCWAEVPQITPSPLWLRILRFAFRCQGNGVPHAVPLPFRQLLAAHNLRTSYSLLCQSRFQFIQRCPAYITAPSTRSSGR